jgi:hypothetical protein
MSSLPTPTPVYVPASTRQSVVVTDVDMSIFSMCRFMVKWAIAAIPAFIILWIVAFAAFAFIYAFLGLPSHLH